MPKRITNSQILGEQGVNLIAHYVLAMGFAWHPSNASLDAGIDGHIELRDADTGTMSTTVLLVQSKARTFFERETPEHIDFTCEKGDLEYWLQGNAPVLLVCSKPKDREAWWVSVKDYFRDPERRRTRKVRFDRTKDRFDETARSALLHLAASAGMGTYFAPVRRREELITNLLPVYRFPAHLYAADTEFRDKDALKNRLREFIEYPPLEWILNEGKLVSVHDLSSEPWRRVCLGTAAVRIETQSWKLSDDPDIKRNFVKLLNRCLIAKLGPLGMRYHPDEDCLYFKATKDLGPREVSYHSHTNKTSRIVFKGYAAKKEPERISYYRHIAFERNFRRYGDEWFLEINPTYVFTVDGQKPHPYREELLSRIKTLEGSGAVAHMVIMFADLLKDPYGLFAKPYPHLGFGQLRSFNVFEGIDDSAWLKADELQPSRDESATDGLGLFEQ